jgi:hypothetical protein
MADIRNPNYETVTAVCDSCGAECTFHRLDDLRENMPIAGKMVRCTSCGAEFWIKGDRVSSPYQFLFDDARRHFEAKQYIPAVATLGTAWEAFFRACAVSTFVYRPFFASEHLRFAEKLNRLSEALRTEIRKFTFFPLRNLVINIAVRGIRPVDTNTAESEIARIRSEKWGDNPPAAAIAAAPTLRLREAAEGLLGLTVGELRNRVVHSGSFRPSRDQVEPCVESELSVLYRVKHRLGVGDWLEHQAGLVYEEQ